MVNENKELEELQELINKEQPIENGFRKGITKKRTTNKSY